MDAFAIRPGPPRGVARFLLSAAIGLGACPLRAGAAPADEARVDGAIQRLTLDQCVDIAVRNQPAIAAQQSAVEAAEHLSSVARSGFFPQANANVAYLQLSSPFRVTIQNPLTPQARLLQAESSAFFGVANQAGSQAALALLSNPKSPPFASVISKAEQAIPNVYPTELFGQSVLTSQATVTQPLYTGGKIRSRYEQSKLGVEAARQDATKSRQETIYGVTTAYQGVLLVEALSKIADDTAGQYRAIERLARSLREQGIEGISEADERRASTLKGMAEAEQIRFKRAREVAYAALQQVMGTGERLPFLIADTEMTPQGAPPDLPSILSHAMTHRPELAKARIGTKVADLETKVAAAQFHPNIALIGQMINLNSNYNAFTPNTYAAVGVGVDIPLFAGGGRIAQARRAQSQFGQAARTQELAESLITLEVKKNYQDFLEQAEKLPILDEAVQNARGAIKIYKAQFAGDAIEEKDFPKYFENVLISRLLLSQALGQYYQAVYGYNNQITKLRLVAGAL